MPEFLNAQGPEGLEHKALTADAGSALLGADEATGVVEALVSVTGVPDEVNDIILPGAYAETLAKRRPKVILGHDWQKWVARCEEAKELLPGDPALPKTTRDGKPWPREAGALYVKAKFNLDTPEGKSTFSNVKFFSETGECEWSIGYRVPRGGSTKGAGGLRNIKRLDLFEASPVLFGAAPLSGTLTVKAAGAATDDDQDQEPDGETGSDPVDPDTREADAGDPDMTALHAAAIQEMNEQDTGWDAVDAASEIDPREEEITSGTQDALQAADERRQGAKGLRPGGFGVKGAGVSTKPWSDFSAADYTPAQWHAATLIHDHDPDGGSGGYPKSQCKLPVREPNGALNVNGVHAAAGVLAGARGGVDASAAQKQAASGKLRGLYRQIGQPAPSSLQAKVLTSADVTGTPPTGPSGPAQLRAREATAFSGDPAAYSLSQWHDATLVHNHPDGTMPGSKDDCCLPVATPGGALSVDGMNQAAQSLAGDGSDLGGASPAQQRDAGTALLMLFRRTGETPPASLAGMQSKAAGQDVTPADMRATERLKQWYEHGGGAAQIGWGTDGDFDKCVAIAGKHMDPAKAKGYCQLRHKGATGFYAGHAPSEELAHGAAAAAAAVAGKKGVIDPAALGSGGRGAVGWYDPALEAGEYAGHLPAETKTAAFDMPGDVPGTVPLEERIDAVTAAVTAALGGALPGEAGMPRRIVAVNGTWPDRVIATSYDTHGTTAGGESFSVPYQYDPAGGGVRLGDPEPVLLTLPAAGSGTKSLGDAAEQLSAVPVLIEYLTGFIRRDLSHERKSGRVLSDANARLLRGAVDQLIAVLNSAGISLDAEPGQEPDEQAQALNEQTSSALYLPDSTAPAAQVSGQKVLIDPELMARAYRITAAAHAAVD